MKKQSLSALVAAGLLAGGLSVTSASAADLGGNCCADLEERIAELEATTVRKGNRKVSLTISGWVAEQVMWWDDGDESNVYVGGIGTTIGTNVKFTGQATIIPGWTAGYVIHLEADGSDGLGGLNQNVDNAPGFFAGSTNYVQTLQSFWFIKSESLGKLSVGLQSQASDNTSILVDGSGSLIPANFVAFDYGSFFAGSSTWGGLAGCSDCNGVPLNSVRYDTPTFAGFSASASWGEDDFWDVALRYAGEFAGFKLAAAAAYSESSDDGTQAVNSALGITETDYFQVGAYIQHVPTGLFLYGAYGEIDSDSALVDNEYWYVKGGLRQRWTPLGHTVLYGEYGDYDNTANASEVELYGIGIVQEIDNAAMSLWLSYRHLEGDETGGPVVEDFDYVKAGALINF
ncbi:porin [Hyphomicrobium sp.]|uniref:porin n=1 Tax=Hyphomicrobium sp. TaxID=82 RepID=UPI0025C2A07B|nr:porin [Hyphomicrobium sp.]MCC7252167.1 porin [Hyphomicrobium sp.]